MVPKSDPASMLVPARPRHASHARNSPPARSRTFWEFQPKGNHGHPIDHHGFSTFWSHHRIEKKTVGEFEAPHINCEEAALFGDPPSPPQAPQRVTRCHLRCSTAPRRFGSTSPHLRSGDLGHSAAVVRWHQDIAPCGVRFMDEILPLVN